MASVEKVEKDYNLKNSNEEIRLMQALQNSSRSFSSIRSQLYQFQPKTERKP